MCISNAVPNPMEYVYDLAMELFPNFCKKRLYCLRTTKKGAFCSLFD